MFEVDENGQMQYIPDTGSTPDPYLPADSLYSAPVDQEEEMQASPSPAPEEGSDLETDPDTGQVLDVSGSDLVPWSGDYNITTSGDVYIYPDLPELETFTLDDARSATSATVTGLPNSTSLSYLENVARGYPAWYKYMSFKTDASYSQSQVLYIGEKAEKNPSQNRIDFTNVDRIEISYVRQSTQNYYYQYSKTHYDSYQIPYNTDVFLYTNVVDGYAEFDIPSSNRPINQWIPTACIVIVLLLTILAIRKVTKY